MALRVRVSNTPNSAGGTARRGDVVVLMAATLALTGAILHNLGAFGGRSLGVIADSVPVAIYLGAAGLGFLARTRTAATWVLLVMGWVMVVTALLGVVPRSVDQLASDRSAYLVLHAVVLVTQVPLIIVLIRRLNRDAVGRAW